MRKQVKFPGTPCLSGNFRPDPADFCLFSGNHSRLFFMACYSLYRPHIPAIQAVIRAAGVSPSMPALFLSAAESRMVQEPDADSLISPDFFTNPPLFFFRFRNKRSFFSLHL